MMLLRDSSRVLPRHKGAVLALGNFDGLHLGHQAVISRAVALAAHTGRPAGLVTFEPHPRRVFAPDLPPLRILPLSEKLHLLKKMDLDFLRIIRFTRTFARTSPEEFCLQLLHRQLEASHVITGEDFVFGHERAGNPESLARMASGLGFTASTAAVVNVMGGRCSSTRIRDALSGGDMPLARVLLGRAYRLSGQVVVGDRRGRTLGFPTANLRPPPVFLPAFGVYAVHAHVRGQTLLGVANLGMRPTFSGTHPRLEVHLFDWEEDIYGERMDVEPVHYIRAETKFADLGALTAQIAEDAAHARHMLTPVTPGVGA